MSATITYVQPGSIAAKKKIKAGDVLLAVNGHRVNDVLDYRFYLNDEKVILDLSTDTVSHRLVRIVKDEYEDIGLCFETYLMDSQRSCKNKCVFCFIDQMPKGMRESLYFKDDDSRLSFFFGNYVTLTNLTDEEVERLITMHISPVNVSVHTMNPELRVKMMKNPHAGESLGYLSRFAEAGTKLNTQLVLCPGINDGAELEFSLTELKKLIPAVQSIACVPVGLTKHREGLCSLRGFTPEEAGRVIDTVDAFNRELAEEGLEPVAFAADEFFLKAGREIPPEEYYGDYPQLENGVGMWRLFESEFRAALNLADPSELDGERLVTCVTGEAAYPLISGLALAAREKFGGLKVNVVKAENRLFGSSVTVAGLLCAADIKYALEGIDLGDRLLIPAVALKRDEDIFLDDVTLDELSEALSVKITPVPNDGGAFLDGLLGN